MAGGSRRTVEHVTNTPQRYRRDIGGSTSTPADGTRGDRQRGAQGAEGGGTGEAEDGGGDSVDRGDSGSRPEGAAETATHGAPHLVPAHGRAARGGGGRVGGA